MRRHSTSQRGFSLVELLIASALSLFLMGGAFLVYLSSRSAHADIEDMSRVQENIRFASDFLVRDIRNAGFRDEGMLTFADWEQICNDYVQLDHEEYPLIIRYGGRGDCISDFEDDDYATVENHYRIGTDADNNPALICGDGDKKEVLVSGVSKLAVDPLCPDGTTSCLCPDECIGLRIALEFESRGSNGIGDRSVELKAVFRNRVYESFDEDEPRCPEET